VRARCPPPHPPNGLHLSPGDAGAFLHAGLASTHPRYLAGPDVAAHGRRGRSLVAWRRVPINEPLGVLSQVRVEGAFEHLARDVLGDVPGPTLGGVEGDHAKRARILPAQKIADHRFPIGLGNIGLDEDAAERAEIYSPSAGFRVMQITFDGRPAVSAVSGRPGPRGKR
jgi:hypothetical protein